MAIGRARRFERLKPRVTAVFGTDRTVIRTVGYVFELMEMAWHDCYGEVSPPEAVVDNVLLCSRGTLEGLVTAAHLAVIDWRDLEMWAADVRRESGRD